MALEIERKFLISHIPANLQSWKQIRQAYLHADAGRSVRIRITEDSQCARIAHIAIKGPTEQGHFTRCEFEYEIPLQDAEAIIRLCDHPPVEKTRYIYPFGGRQWELDVFRGANDGLLIAEIELQTESEKVELPPFVLKEVTGDPRYFNFYLAYHPFKTWEIREREGT